MNNDLQVYQKLAQIESWNNWHTSAWVLRSPGLDRLAPGNKFAYTAPFVLGNIQSKVEDSCEGKVRYLKVITIFMTVSSVSS